MKQLVLFFALILTTQSFCQQEIHLDFKNKNFRKKDLDSLEKAEKQLQKTIIKSSSTILI